MAFIDNAVSSKRVYNRVREHSNVLKWELKETENRNRRVRLGNLRDRHTDEHILTLANIKFYIQIGSCL